MRTVQQNAHIIAHVCARIQLLHPKTSLSGQGPLGFGAATGYQLRGTHTPDSTDTTTKAQIHQTQLTQPTRHNYTRLN